MPGGGDHGLRNPQSSRATALFSATPGESKARCMGPTSHVPRHVRLHPYLARCPWVHVQRME